MHSVMVIAILALLAVPAAAEEARGALTTTKEKTSYFIGADTGRRMKAELDRQSIEYDPEVVGRAVQDALAGKPPAMDESQMEDVRQSLQKELAAKNQERTRALAEKNRKEGEAFLAANRKKEGVKTTETGLQFKVLVQGKGKAPRMTDTVTVNYRGALLDGTEFDSSLKRGKPATFSLDQVISGWSEALSMMIEGSKWEVVVPAKLAYGPLGTPGGQIGPNAVLIFEIELLSVKDAVLLEMQPGPKGK